MKQIIEQLRHEWQNGTWIPTKGECWQGADMRIVKEPAKTHDVVVVTQFADEVSSLIVALRDRLSEYITVNNKYLFYQGLGLAANQAITKKGDSLHSILDALFDKAESLAHEIDSFLYFAYGSNMDEAQMQRRCPGAEPIGIGTMPNYRFAIDNRGVATILPDKSASVEGVVWLVTKRHIQSLDRYEGVRGGFYRQKFLLVSVDGQEYNALVYLSNHPCDAPGHREGYLGKILRAAEAHGLSDSYITTLRQLAV